MEELTKGPAENALRLTLFCWHFIGNACLYMFAKTNPSLILLDSLFAFKSIERELITAAINSCFKEGKHLAGGNKKGW